MRRTLKALIATAALALLLPALAQAASPTLNGQTLAGAGGTHDLETGGADPTCDPGTGEGTITYEGLTGFAGSPYLGTFVESGKLHFDGNGNFTLLEADVTITSVLGTVTVHKTGAPGPNGPGFCNFSGFSAGPALPGSITYTATLPDSTTDSGTSTFHGSGPSNPFIGGGNLSGGNPPFNGGLDELLTSTAHPTSTTVDCSPDTVVVGEETTCTATVTDTAADPTTPTGDVAFATTGPGSFSPASCTLQETSTGVASCDVTYTPSATPATPVRTDAITASYPGDERHTGSSGTTTVQVLSITRVAQGSFVIGDQDATIGNSVTFWGAQWWKLNTLSGGRAPSSFKGFAAQTASNPPECGEEWTTRPGNSSDPPASVPPLMAVIASSEIDKSGSTISGDTDKVVVVRTNPGYGRSPGHAGTGTVVAEVCQS